MCEDKNIVSLKEKTESDQLNELFTALSKAQSEIEFAAADKTNPFFKSKYGDMSSVMRVAREPLGKNGLSVIQRVLTSPTNQMFLLTRLCHASGQWIESKMPVTPSKSDIQSIGSYMTYVKRYSWSAMVGVTVGEEDKKDDDDGETAMPRNQKKEEKVIEIPKEIEKPIEKITPSQIREIDKLLFDLQEADEKAVLKYCRVNSIKDITQDKYDDVIISLTARNKKLKGVKNENS